MCFSKINFNKFVISQKYTSSSTFKLLFGKIFLPLKLLDTNSKLNCTPVYKFILHRVPGHVNKTKWPTKDEHSLKMLPQTRQFGQFNFYLVYCYNCDKEKRPQSRTPTHQASLTTYKTSPAKQTKLCEGHTVLLVSDLKNVVSTTHTC